MSILDHSPDFSIEDAIKIANDLYAIRVQAKSLPSERDQNFLLQSENGDKFVLKVANSTEDLRMLEAQNQILDHLGKHVKFCPRPVPAINGEEIVAKKSKDGDLCLVRLVTYLPGTPLGNTKRHSHQLMQDIGLKMGLVTNALQNYDHPALHRDFHWDLANGLDIIQNFLDLVVEPDLRQLIQQLRDQFESSVKPLLDDLRMSIIHNDANDFNLLVGGGDDLYTHDQNMVGLIDFGDMVYSYKIGELAVAISYAILNKPDPLETAAQIVRGFYSVCPITDREFTVLFGLITLRLCMSVCIAAEQQSHQPGNAYLGISQVPIRNTLPRIAKIHPNFAQAVFRDACGLPPLQSALLVNDWLRSNMDSFASPLDTNLQSEPVAILDLGMSSPLISSDPIQNEELFLTARIQQAIHSAGATVGIGRYDEARYIYSSPAFTTGDDRNSEFRSIHLGIDLFVPPDSPIYAPLDGIVFAFSDNVENQEYGPVILLEHKNILHPTFYTLYGHVSRSPLEGLTIGQQIFKGEKFANIVAASDNGGWTPHLHFQIITDLQDLNCEFPGVALPSQRTVWLGFCPDPNLILGIPESKFPHPKSSLAETLATRLKHMGHNQSISYLEPLKIVRGWKQYLYDQEGRKYLDAYNNVAHVGHNHPRVVAAAQNQIGVLNTNTRYLHDFINHFAEKLTSLFHESLSVCYFVNSGSEANELAIRLARTFTGHHDMIVLDHAYHGNTNTLIDISPYKHNGPGGKGTPDWVHIAPIPDDYRGKYKRNDPLAGEKYARHVFDITVDMNKNGCKLAGFIAESLPSVGGQIVMPDGYLPDVFQYVRQYGGVCIVDEVQTGFGRIGCHFWGFEAQNVVPDIVVLGKPIGNGHPLGAVITTPAIADAFNNGMEYFSTFGGNPVSCAVGLEVLNIVLEEHLQEHALIVGNHLLDGLRPLIDQYPIVGDVRGSGLFIGMELVSNRITLEPATKEASFVINRIRQHGILVGIDGPYHNVVKIRPPMPFNIQNADLLVETIKKVLSEVQ